MARKSKGGKGGKQGARYAHTPLDKLHRTKQVLQSPYHRLPGGLQFSSWRDDYLPNMLWAAIVVTSLERGNAIQLFRDILIGLQRRDDRERIFLGHNWLSVLSPDDFSAIFQPVVKSSDAAGALTALQLIESLPDRERWMTLLPAEPPQDAWHILARAIAECFDHQSQAATDIRWLKIMTLILSGRMKFPDKLEWRQRTEEFRLYPDFGDMKVVRPSIPAAEMMTRMNENGDNKPEHVPSIDAEAFWRECRSKTECFVLRSHDVDELDRAALINELSDLSSSLDEHVDQMRPETGVDPRRDGAVGLALYSMAIAIELSLGTIHQLAGGRIYLRTLAEVAITLHYLTKKDDPAIWLQYRNYGLGQAKLAFLKHIDEQDLPEYVSIETLENLANDDTWLEFQDINLGAWGGKPLRTMAIECGFKDIYDKYYPWPSGFTHGHWTAVRDSVFTTCLNPLHRFHRVPAPTRQMESVLFDACRLVNLMIDDVNHLYPGFRPRVTWHKNAANAGPESEPPPTATVEDATPPQEA